MWSVLLHGLHAVQRFRNADTASVMMVDDFIGLRVRPNCSAFVSPRWRKGDRVILQTSNVEEDFGNWSRHPCVVQSHVYPLRERRLRSCACTRPSANGCTSNGVALPSSQCGCRRDAVFPNGMCFVTSACADSRTSSLYPGAHYIQDCPGDGSTGTSCEDTYHEFQTTLNTSAVDEAWKVTRGSNVSVIVLDDGIAPHTEFTVAETRLLFPVGARVHGTSVAGILAAAHNGAGMCGIAPDARLVDVNLLAANVFVSDAAEAIAFEYDDERTAVFCSSWGPNDDGRCERPGEDTTAAMEAAIFSGRNGLGAPLIFAAGNGGPDENVNDDGYANSPYTIAVSATQNDHVAYFGEWGACILVCANGFQVLTTNHNYGYTYFYGTSAAAPVVAGVVALMLSVNNGLGWRDIQAILMETARPLPSPGWMTNAVGRRYHYHFGAGRVDATAAVGLAAHWSNLGPRIADNVTWSGDVSGDVVVLLPSRRALRVEHVQVCVQLRDVRVGHVRLSVESPHGTSALLTNVTARTSAEHPCLYDDWCFTSLVQWGETARGVWRLRASLSVGRFQRATLRLWGTSMSCDDDE